MNTVNIVWLRRDLRLKDNHALSLAFQSDQKVLPIFIFDTDILNKLEDKDDARVTFLVNTINQLKSELQGFGSDLKVYIGKPLDVWKGITNEHLVKSVYVNEDYEPYAINRDTEIKQYLESSNIGFVTSIDHVILPKDRVLKADGTIYQVYTPYSKMWRKQLTNNDLKTYDSSNTSKFFKIYEPQDKIRVENLGFTKSTVSIPSSSIDKNVIAEYHETRDIPAKDGTTRLSLHLRFGTISIRDAYKAGSVSNKWQNELIWREFYSYILYHHPEVVSHSFKPAYDRIEWRNDVDEFDKWCQGKTGIPIVDAGMRELNETGFMHNRVRMIVASFLTKNLLIDWRWGEAYFARKLLDFDLASNNGGWQWAAGSGVDAAPYFRVFSPVLQQQKFDPDGKYVKKWVSEFNSLNYPKPMVDLKETRLRCLETYKKALS